MENRLRRILEYQVFSPNKRLAAMIEETEGRILALSDDDLFMVAAAGEPEAAHDIMERKHDADSVL